LRACRRAALIVDLTIQKGKIMTVSIAISRPSMVLLAASLMAGCANQPGISAHDAIQGAVNAIGASLGGKPAAATTAAAGDPAPVGAKVVVINGILIAVDGEHPSDPRWAGKRIKDTPLFHFFEQHPSSRPGEYFPRIGIRIDDYSPSLVADTVSTKHTIGISSATPRPLECIKFTAMVWMSAKQSQKVDNVVLCSSDISSKDGYMTMGALRNYASTLYAPISISSMQLRTLGPREPEKLLPNFTAADVALYGQGQHLFSSLFSQLAYQGPVDGDQRLWFVNLATPAK